MKKLRAHQGGVVAELKKFAVQNANSITARAFVVMPPGTGKTVIFSEFVREMRAPALVFSPTTTILRQNMQTMKLQAPDLKVTAYYQNDKDLSGDVVFTTYASAITLIENGLILSDQFRYLIFDEAHRCLSELRQGILEKMHGTCIGFTATDVFSDIKQVKHIFHNQIYRMKLTEATELGLITPIRVMVVDTDIQINNIRLSHSLSLKDDEAEKRFHIAKRNTMILNFYRDTLLPAQVPSVFFCVSVQHSEDLAALFREQGIKAHAVHGSLSGRRKEDLLDSFQHGAYDVLMTCDLLIEGWDCPRLVVAVNVRPTYSIVVAQQRALRISRLYKQKAFGLVVEFRDKYDQGFRPIFIHDILGVHKYRQGGYLAAPVTLLALENATLQKGEPIRLWNGLYVSQEEYYMPTIREDRQAAPLADIKNVRTVIMDAVTDYRFLSPYSFLDMEFDHDLFSGSGRRLYDLYRHFTFRAKLSVAQFLIEVLGDCFDIPGSDDGDEEGDIVSQYTSALQKGKRLTGDKYAYFSI